MTRWFSLLLGVALVAHVAGLAARHNEPLAAERPASVQLVAVTSESTAASQSVLITATEPVSYTSIQPDPLTVLITLRDVAAGDVASRLRMEPGDPVKTVKHVSVVSNTSGLTRVELYLARPAMYRIETPGGNPERLRVVFPRDRAIDPVAWIGGDPQGRRPFARCLLRVGRLCRGRQSGRARRLPGWMDPRRTASRGRPCCGLCRATCRRRSGQRFDN